MAGILEDSPHLRQRRQGYFCETFASRYAIGTRGEIVGSARENSLTVYGSENEVRKCPRDYQTLNSKKTMTRLATTSSLFIVLSLGVTVSAQ